MARKNGRTVLVVEDEPLVMDLVTNVLTRNGYDVVAATDGDQATELFRQHASELCFLVVNIALPKTSGLEFVEQLPTRVPRIPVIFITGLGEHQEWVKRAEEEGFAVLQKPFSAATLMDFVLTAASHQQLAVRENSES
jgi:DNA-binding NtrC family response regulator